MTGWRDDGDDEAGPTRYFVRVRPGGQFRESYTAPKPLAADARFLLDGRVYHVLGTFRDDGLESEEERRMKEGAPPTLLDLDSTALWVDCRDAGSLAPGKR